MAGPLAASMAEPNFAEFRTKKLPSKA